MIRTKLCLTLSVLFTLAFAAAAPAQDFDYGDIDLSPAELYDEALKYLYAADGYKKSRSAALSHLKKAAEQNYAPAHNMLGSLYLESNGFFASPRKALRSFEEAAALGDTLGKYNAAYSYLVGRGTQPSTAQAEKHFLAVVDDSTTRTLTPEDFGTIRNARASSYFYLGLIYSDKDDAAFFDSPKATQMFHKADELHEPSAAMFLAIRYARGEGAEQDQAKSEAFLERYKIAAVNKLHNSVSQVFFQGMDRENVRDSLDDLVANYEDQMTKRIQSMQTSFGISLLDEEELYSPEQAFVWLEPVATPDNHLACSRLATLYYRGEGTEQNLEKARQLLEQAAKINTMAKYNLAVMLANGDGGPADLERAAVLLDRAAKASWYPAIYYGTPDKAQFITERDAIALAKSEANKKTPEALYCYGRRMLFGFGIERNYEAAKAMILEAAELGNVQARFFYGVYIASDFAWLGASEEDKAIQAAADAGYPPAIHHRGQKAENANRYKVALENFEHAAALGNTPSLYKIGNYYLEGRGVDVDYAKAVRYFREAAELEDPIGLLNLGLAYEYGFGVEPDIAEAYRLYKEAKSLGSYYAEYTIGNLLASGKLGEAAWEEAIPHWETAGEYRNKLALLQLSECYREGKGVTKNPTLALNYYNRAYILTYYGDNDTNFQLTQLKLDPSSELYSPKKALAMLRMLELGGYPLAGYQLAYMNLEGVALKKNPSKAYNKFLKTAKELGSELRTELGSDFDRYYSSETDLKKSAAPTDRSSEIIQKAALDACHQIATLLRSGELKKTAPADALAWYKIAAKRNHAPSQFELGQVYLSGQYGEKDEQRGWSWILKSVATLPEAKLFAAKQYFNGTYQKLGEDTATAYLRSAAKSGLEQAAALLKEKGIPLNSESQEDQASPLPPREGEDDGFDGPIDLDVA